MLYFVFILLLYFTGSLLNINFNNYSSVYLNGDLSHWGLCLLCLGGCCHGNHPCLGGRGPVLQFNNCGLDPGLPWVVAAVTASLDVGGLAPGVNRSPNYRYFTAVPSQVFDICFDILRDKERVLVMFMVHGG